MEIQPATYFSHLITELPENKASHQTIALTKGKSQRHRSFLTTCELGFLPTIRIETTTYLLHRIYCQVSRAGGNGRLNLPHGQDSCRHPEVGSSVPPGHRSQDPFLRCRWNGPELPDALPGLSAARLNESGFRIYGNYI